MKNLKTLLILAMFLTMVCNLCMAIELQKHHSKTTLKGTQWDMLDIQFTVPKLPKHPTDIDFTVKFQAKNGTDLTVPGFYNGANHYLVRFTPPTTGTWQYQTSSDVSALNNLAGKVNVQAARPGRKGAIVVDSQSPRRFRYQNGDLYYAIAFESDWLFALDAENAKDIPDTRKLVDTIAESGFNQVVMNVFAYDVSWGKDKGLKPEHEYGSPKAFPFGGNNTDPDYNQLNIEYFQRLDRVIEYLDQKEIAAHLMIYVWNKLVNWPPANSEADNRYFDYVVKRYQAFPNMIWDISKEALGYGHDDVDYITQRIDRLRKLDGYKRLVTVHDYGYNKKFPDKVDFISVQLWSSELYSVMRKVCDDFPGQPILNIEHGGYEEGPYVVFPGNYISAETCLERAYQCVFAGTYPTHYWQNAAWNVIIPDISTLKPEDRPRLEYYRHLSTLENKYKFSALKVSNQKSNSGFCLHNDKDLFIYYVPKENISIGVRMPKDKKGYMMTGTWFNPYTGTFSEGERKKITQWPGFKKPTGDGFAILIVEIDKTPPQ